MIKLTVLNFIEISNVSSKSIIMKKLDLNFTDLFLKCRNYHNLKNRSL
ncbi:hypothetical protein LEP1GSC186_4522 [Leptospira noguchii serovar Autumnalis str. ZUN142]|uniref:Uncharacterized protein n=1 Tax=Leptospira noguchii serovar Autumnalis str. ZUN142 TaxID=1085540 RepID=M6UCS8_9LEPT|nr:hypothetical protein LEP1GSC186_4522 [Leptospira noguchii serovar Autumnalis str. ZUN142]